MNNSLSGRVAWVTGAAQGIGAEIAAQLAASGTTVLGIDQHDFRASNGILPFKLDISNADAIQASTESLIAHRGAPDFFVGAAGVLKIATSDALTTTEWEQMLAVNASGHFHILRNLVPHFRKRRSGSIVLIGSNAAHVPRLGMIGYSASKAALAAIGRGIALELAPVGVRCNIISPGSTDTPMQRALWTDDQGEKRTIIGFPEQFKLGIPLGKIATPLDIAELALFLLSDRSGHITMQDIVVDGGATLGA